ncbi:MAG: SDR family oxidoreductase [Acidobacteriota bacterium]|nr:SDR family oxidoreductase [Acidobacteriota bacterium]
MIDLSGRVAIVTGAGRGIGRAIAQKLTAAGASVVVNDLDPGPAEETAALLGAGALAIAGDITAPDFPAHLVARTVNERGGIDIVINNAGYTWDNVIQKTTDEQFQAMLDIHITAPFRLLRAASAYLREAAKRETAEGRRVMRKVVNITSIAATDGGAGQAGYGSGKAAVMGLTRVLAKEWGRYNVNVNCVGFGLIETRLIQPLSGDAKPIEVAGREIKVGVQPAALESLKAMSPFGRAGTVEEAAGPVLFFCSGLSDFVTGEVLICSGGMHF